MGVALLSAAVQRDGVGVAVTCGAEILDARSVKAVAAEDGLVEASAALAVGEGDKGRESELQVARIGVGEVQTPVLYAHCAVALHTDAVASHEQVYRLVGTVASFLERVVVAEEEYHIVFLCGIMQCVEPSHSALIVATVGMDGHVAHDHNRGIVVERVDPCREAACGRLCRYAEGVGSVDAVVGLRAVGLGRHGVGRGAVRRWRWGRRRGRVVALLQVEVDGRLRRRVGGEDHLGVADAVDVVAVAAVRAAEESTVALGAAAVVRAVGEQQLRLGGIHDAEHFAAYIFHREGRLARCAVVRAAPHIVAAKQHHLRHHHLLVGSHQL